MLATKLYPASDYAPFTKPSTKLGSHTTFSSLFLPLASRALITRYPLIFSPSLAILCCTSAASTSAKSA